MKVLPFKIPRNNGEAIIVQNDRQSCIYDVLHKHPELQITLIKQSSGTVIIGGYIGEFKAGDVFVIGSDTPHVFRNDDAYYEEGNKMVADVLYLFLDERLPDNGLLNSSNIDNLFNQSKKGVKIGGKDRELVKEKLIDLQRAGGLDRLIITLSIIRLLCQTNDSIYLNAEVVSSQLDENDGKRLNEIFQFTLENYRKKITLEEVAKMANMTSSSFCRFFKQRTGKKYFDFLNEIRINQACKLLQDKDNSILSICLACGFNNSSHFNKKFKEIVGYSPLKYAKQMYK